MSNSIQASLLREQISEVFRAWGMAEERIKLTVDLMVEADLRGIDSHGIGMLPQYDRQRREGKILIDAEITTTIDEPVVTVVDAGHFLGHVPGEQAMRKAIEKCAVAGLGVSVVRRSNHFGAAGVYSTMAADAGLIGFACTGTSQRSIVPTFAREPMYSTNPIAFAAPVKGQDHFSLDMATSTVAVGKLNIARRAGKPLPVGWALKPDGSPETDAAVAFERKPKRMTPLGGSRELGSHKGYGLAMMVEILGSVLTGSNIGGHRLDTREPDKLLNIGSFFMALDPEFFREELEAFETDMAALTGTLRDVRPIDPDQPVMVAGDPEHKERVRRLSAGVELTDTLIGEIRDVARGCNAPFLLG